MRNLNKVFIFGFSVMFGLSLIACDKESKTSNSNSAAPSQTPSETDSTPVHVHAYDIVTVSKEPTCTEKGTRTYTCSCGDFYTEDIDALNHDYVGSVTKEASCTETGVMTYTCSHDATHTYTEDIPLLSHDLTHYAAKDASCLEEGNTEYWLCSSCGGFFSDESGTIPATREEIFSAKLAHDLTHHEAAEATCESDGNVEYWSCGTCYGYFLDEECVTETTADAVILPRLDHHVEAVHLLNPEFVSSSSTNRTSYYACPYCETVYEDADGTTPVATTAYYWKKIVKDGTEYLVPTNQGVGSSKSTMGFTAVKDCDLTFTFTASSESRWDYLMITVNGKLLYGDGGSIVSSKEELSGTKTGTITLQLNANDVVEISYSKDSSGNNNDDTIYISDLSFADVVPVAVTFVYNDSVTADTVVLTRPGVALSSLPIPTERDGYLFDGWFIDEDEELTNSKVITEPMTVTAKWSVAYVVTVYYNNSDDNLPDLLKFRADTIPSLTTPVKDGYMFNGWFIDEDLTTPYEMTALTGPVTVYASYTSLPGYVGSYSGVETWGTTNGNGSKGSGKTATIGIDLTVTYSTSTVRGVLDPATINAETGEAQMHLNGATYYIWVFEDKNMIIFNYTSTKTTKLSDDLYILVKTSDSVTITSQVIWSNGLERIVELTYGTTTETIYIDAINDAVYFDVTIADLAGNPLTVADIYNSSTKIWAEKIAISSAGNIVTKYVYKNSDYVSLDGTEGTYTGELGAITLDGAGAASMNDTESFAYVLNGEKVELTINGVTKTIVLNAAAGTYAVTTDGTEGTYTGTYGDFVSYGDGTATLNQIAATYAKEGLKLTLKVNGETKVIVLTAEGTYLNNSIFADHTFTGTYYNRWDEMTSSLVIQFNSGAEITGTIYANYGTNYYFEFTAVYEDNILTMTITRAIDSGAVGRTIVGSVSGSTITIISCGISNSAYSFADNGSVSDPTFTA